MKCHIMLVYDGWHGLYPNNAFLKGLGHDLQRLLKLISARQKTPLRAETCDKSATPRA